MESLLGMKMIFPAKRTQQQYHYPSSEEMEYRDGARIAENGFVVSVTLLAISSCKRTFRYSFATVYQLLPARLPNRWFLFR